MKKLLFTVLLFVVNTQVFAMEVNRLSYEKDFTNICDSDGNVYPIYKSEYIFQPMYFLNLSNEYNLNFAEYYEISFENSPFSEEIIDYSGTDLYGDEHFNLGIYSLLWEKLYPEKNFFLCSKYPDSDKKIQYVKDMVNSIVNGPLSKEEIILEEGENYEYENPNYGYFELLSSDGLDIIERNGIISFSAPKGIYEIVYQRKQAGLDNGPSLYTDGINYLLVNTKITNKEFKYKVIVGYETLNIKVVDEKQNVLPNMCFEIKDKSYCTNNNGDIKIYLDSDKYLIAGCNAGYEDYEKEIEVKDDLNLEITLSKKEEPITNVLPENAGGDEEINIEKPIISIQENVNDIKEEKVPIKVADTFTFPSTLIIFILGLLLVKNKVR